MFGWFGPSNAQGPKEPGSPLPLPSREVVLGHISPKFADWLWLSSTAGVSTRVKGSAGQGATLDRRLWVACPHCPRIWLKVGPLVPRVRS